MASPFQFKKHGQSGIEVSELFPNIARRIDDFCVVRSTRTDIRNHPPAMLMMSCGRNVPGWPSMGSWITYGLGTGNQNLGFKSGCVYGATDEFGWHAVENPVHVHDLHATMLHQLGLDHTRLTYHYSGRDSRLTDVEGNIVRDLLA